MLFNLDRGKFSHSGLAYFFFLFFATLIIAAILAGPVYIFLSTVAHPIAKYAVQRGIGKIYCRIVLLSAIVCLLFCSKKFEIAGLIAMRERGVETCKTVLKWAGFGGVFIAIVAAIEAVCSGGNVVFSRSAFCQLVAGLPKFIVSAMVVGIVEEILFRGVVLKVFYTAFNPILAIIFSSIFFACMHAKVSVSNCIEGDSVGPLSGFNCLASLLLGFLHTFNWLQFAKLVAFGAILSAITLKSRSLYQAIGFHSGSILMLFVANIFT